jgi:hypothetical protein
MTFRRCGRLLLTGTLLACATFCGGCLGRRTEYRPVDDQVFAVPKGTRLTAMPGTVIVTDGPEGKVQLHDMTLGYDGVLLSDGLFLKLYEASRACRASSTALTGE